MLIKSCQISNYKSFRASEEFKFTPGFNVVVGQNSAGKTALIEALSLQFGDKPHRSPKTVERRGSPNDGASKVGLTFQITNDEFVSILSMVGQIYIPASLNEITDTTVARFQGAIQNGVEIGFEYGSGSNFTSSHLTGFGAAFGDPTIRLTLDTKSGKFVHSGPSLTNLSNPKGTFAAHLLSGLQNRIYVFRAERLNVGQCATGINPTLLPNASNLAAARSPKSDA